ncbi:hypothetical protein F4818DRAFT_418980 [Hypoxylon cercidicola]|nr:hypothetical protein F4818DRAFT_418980 [Hypoxylon cercidicola]
MVLRECNLDGCRRPAARRFGSCMICSKHWCFEHAKSEDHKCPSEESDPSTYYAAYAAAKKNHLSALLDKVNIEALRSAASGARNGVKCWIPAFDANSDPAARADLASKQSGGQNCHLDIEFEDSVVWVARLRFEDPLLPPAGVQRHIFLSEVATLKFLAQTSVPAPRVHSYQLESPDNPIGTSYILMSKLEGSPLDWYEASSQQRIKVMEQLADLYLEFEKYPFQLTGSFVPSGISDDEVNIGGFAQEPWFETPDKGLGPFSTLEAAYTAILDRYMQAFDDREISKLPVDNYLSFKWRLSSLQALIASSTSKNGPFYLKHYDDKGDHILVDENYNITGIIDWEFASLEAKELAFSSPCMMWPVGDFYDGKPDLSEDEVRFAEIFNSRGRQDIANLVLNSRKWQRYLFFLGGDVPSDEAEFEALFQSLRKCFADTDENVSSYQEWKQIALELYHGDPVLDSLIRDEISGP